MTFDPNQPRGPHGRWIHLAGLMKSKGGFTHINGVTNPPEGYSVGVKTLHGESDWATIPHGQTRARDIARFERHFKDELAKPNRGIGGWSNSNPDWGEVRDALDVIEVHKTLDDAMKAAKANSQDAIFDLSAGKEIPVTKDLSIFTPSFEGTFDLSVSDGKLAFWKQILPKRQIHYTAKDGKRHTLNFDDAYLADLANNRAVDQVPFMLADADNRHTMDPERQRGAIEKFEVREDGLYGKIVFPNREAARAVLDNPNLGVSARIREGIAKSDGSSLSRGIIHVLGTLDPQVSGMSGWQTADLSIEAGDLLDLTDATYEDGIMTDKKSVADYTDEEIEAMSDEELEAFLADAATEFEGILDEDGLDEEEVDQNVREPEMALSTEAKAEIDLANSRANEALRQLGEARWERERESYQRDGVPPALLDLAAPVLNRPDEFVVDLSVTDGADAEVDVSKIVRGLLDAAKGTIDLSEEAGHSGTFHNGDGEDPDAEALKVWDAQY